MMRNELPPTGGVHPLGRVNRGRLALVAGLLLLAGVSGPILSSSAAWVVSEGQTGNFQTVSWPLPASTFYYDCANQQASAVPIPTGAVDAQVVLEGSAGQSQSGGGGVGTAILALVPVSTTSYGDLSVSVGCQGRVRPTAGRPATGPAGPGERAPPAPVAPVAEPAPSAAPREPP